MRACQGRKPRPEMRERRLRPDAGAGREAQQPAARDACRRQPFAEDRGTDPRPAPETYLGLVEQPVRFRSQRCLERLAQRRADESVGTRRTDRSGATSAAA